MKLPRFIRWIFLLVLMTSLSVQDVSGSDSASSSSSSSSDDEDNSGGKEKDDVVILTSVNFDKHMRGGSVWLVEFYAPWCGHCMNFAPAYSEIAAYFRSHPEHNVKVGKIDTTVQKALGTRFGVRAYPSFFVVHGSSVYEFDGSRTKTNLISFASKDYKELTAIPFIESPMGPMGRLQGFLIWAGVTLLDIFEWVKTTTGLSSLLAGCLVCGLVVVAGMFSMLILVIALTPKEKAD